MFGYKKPPKRVKGPTQMLKTRLPSPLLGPGVVGSMRVGSGGPVFIHDVVLELHGPC